jgi:hypothetical protein
MLLRKLKQKRTVMPPKTRSASLTMKTEARNPACDIKMSDNKSTTTRTSSEAQEPQPENEDANSEQEN